MSRRALAWAAAFAVVGIIDLAGTAAARASWHATPGGPAVMPLDQLMGFITSAGLLIVAALIVIASVNNARRMRPYGARVRRRRRVYVRSRRAGEYSAPLNLLDDAQRGDRELGR